MGKYCLRDSLKNFTKVTDLSEFHGDGWRLVSDEARKVEENPFSELLKDFGEE